MFPPYILLFVMRKKDILICLMLKIYLENTDFLCYPKLVFVRFDLLSNLHDQKEYDNYYVISREADLLATPKTKNKIKYSLVNPCGKNKHRFHIKKVIKKKQRSPTA